MKILLDYISKFLDRIPGFRSRKLWHMLIASIYYILCLVNIGSNFFVVIVLLALPFAIFSFSKYRNSKSGVSDIRTSRNGENLLKVNRAAIVNVLNINTVNCSGRFLGSEGEIYETTVKHCDCQDFLKRHSPCKHIYRLLSDCGKLDRSEYLKLLSRIDFDDYVSPSGGFMNFGMLDHRAP